MQEKVSREYCPLSAYVQMNIDDEENDEPSDAKSRAIPNINEANVRALRQSYGLARRDNDEDSLCSSLSGNSHFWLPDSASRRKKFVRR